MSIRSWILGLALLVQTASYAQLSHWESSLDRVYNEGKVLYEQQMYAAASERFKEVMDRTPFQKVLLAEKAEFFRAMCAVKLMNRDAENLMNGFLENHPTSSFRYDGVWAVADYHFKQRRYDNALEWLQKLDRLGLKSGDRESYYFKTGYSLFMEEKPEAAKTAFREIKDGSGSLASSAKYYYAHLNYADSNYVTALNEFIALREDPAFGKMVPYYLAQIYYQTGDDEKLLEVGTELLDQSTEARAAEVAKLVGLAMYRQKRYEEALPFLESHREKGGSMGQKEYYQLGVCYHAVGRYREAVDCLNKVTANNVELAQTASYLLADSYLKVGDKNQALTAFKATYEQTGDALLAEEAHYYYAKLSYELANPFENAIQAMTDFQKKYPQSVYRREINGYLANLYLTTKDYANALAAIEASGLESVMMRETYQKVSYYLGVEYFNGMQWDRAREMFTQSLKYPINNTVSALAHYWTGEVLYRKKDYLGALKAYKDFQNLPGAQSLSEYPLSQYNVAYAYFMLEDYSAASTNFRLFVSNRRADVSRKLDATLRLADSYFMQGSYAQAEGYYTQFIQGRGREADYASFQRALTYGLTDEDNKKIEELRRILREYPESNLAMDARYELGMSLLRADRNTEALSEFKAFRAQYPQTAQARRALLQMGAIYRNTGDYNRSIDVFKQLVEDYPGTEEARVGISYARLVYDQADRIEDYLDWVKGISFANVQDATLDSTMYNSAYEKYGLNRCADAIPAFKSYLERFPDGIFFVQANYFLGECSLGEENLAQARTAFTAVVSGPPNDYTERSWLQIGNIALAQSDNTAALSAYNEVVQSAQNTERYNAANIGRMRAAGRLNQWEEGLEYARSVRRNATIDEGILNEARLIQARSLWKLNRKEESIRVYRELREEGRGEPRAEASYHLSLQMHNNGQYAASNEEIFWMIDNLPSHQNWRYKSLITLSRNYWKLHDIFQAQYTLDFIIEENYNAEVVAEARALKEEITLASGQTGTEDPGEVEIGTNDGVESKEPAE